MGDGVAPRAPTFGEATRWWFWLGCISFGGPAGQIATLHRELVDRRRWISERRFLHALDLCMVLPGPEAQQLATYLGWLLHGTIGGIVAGGLFVLPGFVVLLGLAWGYLALGDVPVVAGALAAVKPAVVAIVLGAALRIGKRALKTPGAIGIAVTAFLALLAGVAFPWIVGGAALVGAMGHRVAPHAFPAGGGHGPDQGAGAPAVIDDHTPVPAHARATPLRVGLPVAVGLLLGVLAWLGLRGGPLDAMATFFTRAALLTFGGAYAVLPYVVQGGVEQYGWLTAPQMMDGLALGETTPGPLILVVTFVGFLGGWQGGVPGLEPVWAGLAGASVATFFTFLPSFVFILALGPLVEATRARPGLGAPLAGITAAVVGVIVHLGLTFGSAVLWRGGDVDVFGVAVCVAALVGLARFGLGVGAVVGGAALVGLLRAVV